MTTSVFAVDPQTIIEQQLRALFAQTDAQNWSAVEALFASEVTLDYTSMAGGEPAQLSPQAITTAWKGLLPGFESTHHQVGAFNIQVEGTKAQAHLRGLAAHYLPNPGEDVWTVVGSYDFELEQKQEKWVVTLMRFNLEQQVGNLALPALAQAAVQEQKVPTPLTVSPEAETLLHRFFNTLEAMDIQSFMELWAEEGTQIMPFSPAHFPQQLQGKAAIFNQYKGLPEAYTTMRFPHEIVGTSQPDNYIVRYRGIIDLGNGQQYNNNYVGHFSIKDGKIQTFVEYFDPFILEAAFGDQLQANFNVATSVEKEAVSFLSEGLVLKGHLYRPAGFVDHQTYPAVVVAGTWTSVKEQMADRYAEELARGGIMALSFDFRSYGESEGQPRNFENPEWKIQDIQNAVAYLERLPEVDAGAIHGLGICAGAGYIAGAASQSDQLNKIVLVAGWLHNGELVEAIYGGAEGVAAKLQKAQAAKAQYATNGTVAYVPAISKSNPEAAMYGDFDFYLNPERGAISQWDGQFAVMAWEKWLQFDPIAFAPRIQSPTLIVHSEMAAIPTGVRQFYQQLKTEKEEYWTSGQQFDFYDGTEKVKEAVAEALKWLK
ncbi:MAG: alpha/beta fold hydrolase [Bacteroidota bacterium]